VSTLSILNGISLLSTIDVIYYSSVSILSIAAESISFS
jgi:hypothetical protein